ncbi:DUF2507 domain-containing protein [Aciduricibacillus chroicocephali]|uniref:DUF2507 domain-containing protein n=1 Tax=Aciduricibacillus chroicocephali TaxID=3054939 RepID=A0ABY9KSN8_9BACI|nr:DUF2507 domain-containing protein [Bacillaceae bacterium 44XB]
MKKINEGNGFPPSLLEDLHSSGSAYDVLRYIGLPELFGGETHILLYFMGRKLARHFTFNELDDIYNAFERLGWGKLELVKEKRKELVFSLMDDSIARKLTSALPVDFRLEAGFLAEAVHMAFDKSAECMDDINFKIHSVRLTVLYTS